MQQIFGLPIDAVPLGLESVASQLIDDQLRVVFVVLDEEKVDLPLHCRSC